MIPFLEETEQLFDGKFLEEKLMLGVWASSNMQPVIRDSLGAVVI
jgi:hypothetical protein